MNGGNILIIGRRRQGKSTLALFIARRRHKTIVIWDPNSQYNGFHTLYSLDELAEWIAGEDHGEVVFRPDPTDLEDQFEGFVDLLWGQGNYALIIDEASTVQTPHSIHGQLERIMRQAPRDGAKNRSGQLVDVTVIQTTHRPTDLHMICRALATDVFIFQQTLLKDLQRVSDQWGEDVAAQLPELERWHCIHVYTDLDGRQQYKRWDDPTKWHIAIASGGSGSQHGIGSAVLDGPGEPAGGASEGAA